MLAHLLNVPREVEDTVGETLRLDGGDVVEVDGGALQQVEVPGPGRGGPVRDGDPEQVQGLHPLGLGDAVQQQVHLLVGQGRVSG